MTKILKPYLILVLLFLTTAFIFKTVETRLFFKFQDTISFIAILQAFFNITTVFCLYAFVISFFYFLIAFLQQKVAQITASVLFSLLLMLEIGLFMYYHRTGVLMETEIVVRPLAETLVTIRNSSNIIINSILIISILACFIILPFFFKKIKVFNKPLSCITGILILCVLSASTLFYQSENNRTLNNYLKSKSFHFFSALTHYLFYGEKENEERDEAILKEYITLYNKTATDIDYPMERPSSEIPDVLSPYFNKSGKQPNIVIIIVESLGSYFMGDKGNHASFTPFLDSLANTGLYWKNCLSTTPRTFGVVPSVTGSVPHGMKGFQFGVMPNHHSIFSILKNNDYATHFFYGGDITFDSMLDFLTAQEPDHIDNFMPQLGDFQNKEQANYWAIYDQVLFNESFKYLKTVSPQKPKLNIYLTLTTHDQFYGCDKALNNIYEPKTDKIFSKLNPQQKKYFLPIKNLIVPFTYMDDCMRDFIHNYAKQPDFENTIFIITGDHSWGVHKNELAYYSVPLIIWSPLLKTPKIFPNIVSHLAITPSIISFLQNNYTLKVPEKIAWCSDGLDTASTFNPSEKVLFLSYDRKVNAMVYEQYFFQNVSQEDKKLYKIDENLDLEAINDATLMEDINSKFNLLKYVNNYVYHNNKLVKKDTYSGNKYKIITNYENLDSIICRTPDAIPAIHGIDTFDILPVRTINGDYDKIKIKLTTDIIINDLVYQDYQMMLNFICSGDDFNYVSKDNITKYILDDNIFCNQKYVLSTEKEIDVKDLEKFTVHICVTTNESNEAWRPDKKITLFNTRVLIFEK